MSAYSGPTAFRRAKACSLAISTFFSAAAAAFVSAAIFDSSNCLSAIACTRRATSSSCVPLVSMPCCFSAFLSAFSLILLNFLSSFFDKSAMPSGRPSIVTASSFCNSHCALPVIESSSISRVFSSAVSPPESSSTNSAPTLSKCCFASMQDARRLSRSVFLPPSSTPRDLSSSRSSGTFRSEYSGAMSSRYF